MSQEKQNAQSGQKPPVDQVFCLRAKPGGKLVTIRMAKSLHRACTKCRKCEERCQ